MTQQQTTVLAIETSCDETAAAVATGDGTGPRSWKVRFGVIADDRAGLDVECGEQRGRAVAPTVEGPPLGFGRIAVQPDDVAHLADQARVAWLKAGSSRHDPGAPAGGAARGRFQGVRTATSDLHVGDAARGAPSETAKPRAAWPRPLFASGALGQGSPFAVRQLDRCRAGSPASMDYLLVDTDDDAYQNAFHFFGDRAQASHQHSALCSIDSRGSRFAMISPSASDLVTYLESRANRHRRIQIAPDAFRLFLKKHGYTQKGLAKKLGHDDTTIENWRRRITNKINGKFLGTSPEDLIDIASVFLTDKDKTDNWFDATLAIIKEIAIISDDPLSPGGDFHTALTSADSPNPYPRPPTRIRDGDPVLAYYLGDSYFFGSVIETRRHHFLILFDDGDLEPVPKDLVFPANVATPGLHVLHVAKPSPREARISQVQGGSFLLEYRNSDSAPKWVPSSQVCISETMLNAVLDR